MAGKNRQSKWWSAAWLPLLAAFAVIAVARAQTQTPRPVETRVQTFWYDPPHSLQKKMVIHWAENRPLSTGGNLLIRGLTMDTFQETGEPGLTMEAPECLFNNDKLSGSSPGPLKIRTADGTSFIEGTGYLWNFKGSNLTITISNDVATTLKRDFLTSGTNLTAHPLSATNQYVHIHADRVSMDRVANRVVYTGHVHAEDERWDMTCDVLTIRGATNGAIAGSTNVVAGGKISEIVADEHVVIFDKAAGGRANGDRAVYSVVDGAVTVALTGDPRWEDGPSKATARAFIFDLAANTMRAVGEAHFIVPSRSIGKSGFVLLSRPAAAAANAPDTNVSLMDITAGAITLELPATNGTALRGVIAETNVLLTDTDNESRAAADRAVYTQSNGLTELTGNASWQMRRRIARGGLLTFNQTDNTFSARTNAYLQFPPDEFGKSTAAGGLLSTNALRTTNQLVKVSADAYDYQNETLTFSNHVEGAFLEDDVVRDTLQSGWLMVDFLNTNVVRDIIAGNGVHLRQLPVPDLAGQTEEGDFQSDHLRIAMRTNGLVEQFTAGGEVKAVRTEIATNRIGGPAATPLLHTNHATFAADKLTTTFQWNTNKVDVFTGEGNVVAVRDDYTALGGKVVYTATNDFVVLTVDPKLKTTMGWLTADEMITYDHAKGIIEATRSNRLVFDLPDTVLDKINRATMMRPDPK